MTDLSFPQTEALAAAQTLGQFLLEASQETTYGLRYPEYTKEGEVEYHDNLYKGAAGVGLTLLDLFQATDRSEYVQKAQQVGYDLIESTPGPHFIHPGLYSGQAGHVLFYLQAAQLLNNPIFLREACRLGDVLADRPFHGTDIIAGAAGTGLVFLSLYATFRKSNYLEGARRALGYLKETAEQCKKGVCWSPLIPEWGDSPDRFTPYTGLAHGISGICLFLLEWKALGLGDEADALCQSAFRWLDLHKIQHKSGLFWPVSTTDPKLRYHWCHGTTGIAQAYLARYQKLQDSEALEVARQAALTSLEAVRKLPAEPLIHCHGLAGLLELLLDMQQVDTAQEWSKGLAELWPRVQSFTSSFDPTKAQEGHGTSLSLGIAGLIRALLRMSGENVYPILTANRPRQKLPKIKRLPGALLPRPSSSRNDKAEAGKQTAFHAAYIPRIAVNLKNQKYQVVLKQHTLQEQADMLLILRQHPGSHVLSQSIQKIEKASRELEKQFQGLLRPHSLSPEVHGPVVRELSGLCLRPESTDKSVESLVGRFTSQYINMLRLLLSRLNKDRKSLLELDVQGQVCRIELLSADPHRHGQKVVALMFEGGQEYIYKSRSMALERFLVGASRPGEIPSLAGLINQKLQPAVSGASIPTHRIVPGGTQYGYAERIQTRLEPIKQVTLDRGNPQSSQPSTLPIRATILKDKEQDMFWYEAGLVAGFAMGLGLTDLHNENLVCGSTLGHPVLGFHLIDLEMAFYEYECLRDTLLVDLTVVEEPEKAARGFHKHTGFDHEIKMCGSGSEPWVLRPDNSGYRLVPGSPVLASLDYDHLVQNQDGTLGFGSFLPVFLRGMVDVRQEFKACSQEYGEYLKQHLDGAAVRSMAKATRCYIHGIRKNRGRDYPTPGGSWSSEFALPFPIWEDELRQLEQGDIPYFFRFLGNDQVNLSGTRWFEGSPQDQGATAELGKVYEGMDPFWSIIERQSELPVLARSLADAIAFVASAEAFDIKDESMGLRVFRNPEDKELWFVAILQEGRLVCRVEGGGGVSLWLE